MFGFATVMVILMSTSIETVAFVTPTTTGYLLGPRPPPTAVAVPTQPFDVVAPGSTQRSLFNCKRHCSWIREQQCARDHGKSLEATKNFVLNAELWQFISVLRFCGVVSKEIPDLALRSNLLFINFMLTLFPSSYLLSGWWLPEEVRVVQVHAVLSYIYYVGMEIYTCFEQMKVAKQQLQDDPSLSAVKVICPILVTTFLIIGLDTYAWAGRYIDGKLNGSDTKREDMLKSRAEFN